MMQNETTITAMPSPQSYVQITFFPDTYFDT